MKNLGKVYNNPLQKPRKSLIIFDEVQKCPKARESIKALVEDGRFDYLETGSLISIKPWLKDNPCGHFAVLDDDNLDVPNLVSVQVADHKSEHPAIYLPGLWKVQACDVMHVADPAVLGVDVDEFNLASQ